MAIYQDRDWSDNTPVFKDCHRCNTMKEIPVNRNLCKECEKSIEPSGQIGYVELFYVDENGKKTII